TRQTKHGLAERQKLVVKLQPKFIRPRKQHVPEVCRVRHKGRKSQVGQPIRCFVSIANVDRNVSFRIGTGHVNPCNHNLLPDVWTNPKSTLDFDKGYRRRTYLCVNQVTRPGAIDLSQKHNDVPQMTIWRILFAILMKSTEGRWFTSGGRNR